MTCWLPNVSFYHMVEEPQAWGLDLAPWASPPGPQGSSPATPCSEPSSSSLVWLRTCHVSIHPSIQDSNIRLAKMTKPGDTRSSSIVYVRERIHICYPKTSAASCWTSFPEISQLPCFWSPGSADNTGEKGKTSWLSVANCEVHEGLKNKRRMQNMHSGLWGCSKRHSVFPPLYEENSKNQWRK